MPLVCLPVSFEARESLRFTRFLINMADLELLLHHLQLSVVTRTNKEEPIGVGSYASVYEVMVHGTLCAAKEMHPVLMNEANKRTFLSECVQSSRILHPNIVQFLGIYYPPNPRARLPWLVMELMHISLRGLIEKYENDDFPFHFKLSILMDTCHGLQFLHSQNIIHRDLSSNNILLTKHLVAKISDLGMAKVIPPGLQKLTQAPGTVVFMPPEALSVNPQYGKPIDVFSVGCVCVHVISMEWPIPLDQVVNQFHAGRILVCTWFLEITFMWMCVCVCVCPPPEAINN